MLLSALLLAAAVQVTPVPPAFGDQLGPGRATFQGSKAQAVEAVKAREGCPAASVELTAATGAMVRKLGDLPTANHTLTVLRSVDGCPVSSTVRYNVGR